MTAYRRLQEVSAASALRNYPKTLAVAEELAGGNQAEVNRLVTTANSFVAPAIRYFQEKFNKRDTEMFQLNTLLKSLRIFCPAQANEIRLTALHVEELRNLPALDSDDRIARLQEELPVYVTAASDAVIDDTTSHLQWW